MKQDEYLRQQADVIPDMPEHFVQHIDLVLEKIVTEEKAKAAPKPNTVPLMGRFISKRAMVVLVLVIFVTMGTALAAGMFGWVEFLKEHYNVDVPQAAVEELNAAQPVTYQVGPMTFTFRQLLTDQHIVMCVCDIRLTDGSKALYAFDSDIGEHIGVSASGKALARKMNLDPSTSWLEAAQQLNLPLYGVRAFVDVPSGYVTQTMMDAVWDDVGNITCFSMPLLTDDVPNMLPIELNMRVHAVNIETGEIAINQWRETKEITLTATPKLSEKTYYPQGNDTLFIYDTPVMITEVKAERYATGVYFTTSFRMPESMSINDVLDVLSNIMLCDKDRKELPMGLGLSGGEVKTDSLPVATLKTMTSIEELPDTMLLVFRNEQVMVK